MFPSILIQLENGPNEFYFYFTNKNGNISPGAVTEGNLINMAAVERTKLKNIIELQYWTGMSNKIEKKNHFFFNFPKIGSGDRVGKTKNKKLWPTGKQRIVYSQEISH